MSLEGEPKAGCLDEEAALDFVQGRLSQGAVQRIDEHVDGCQLCRAVLAEAARALRSRATGAPVTETAVSSPSMAATRFAPGDKLSGRYRILRFIARGGMGEVYEAHDLMLNTRLAVKTLAATISDDAHAIRRLKQEVNLARLITHPNVCRIFDLGVHEQSGAPSMPGILFITMELVAGTSLGDHVRRHGRMDSAAALPVARAIVAAIGAAHRANIIHRDLKSDNVMLASDEHGAQRVVVMDFGLARAASPSPSPDLTSTDGLVLAGTLPYMAPEQLDGKPVSAVTDVYALGVMMFEMLAGELPFRGQPVLAAAWRRVTEASPALDRVAPGVDPRWTKIVAACLERDPALRPRSAEQVDRLLQSLEMAADTLAPINVSSPARSARVGRRTGLVLAALAALFAFAGARAITRRSRPPANHLLAQPAPVRSEKTVPIDGAGAARLAVPAPPPPTAVDLSGPGPGTAPVSPRRNPQGRAQAAEKAKRPPGQATPEIHFNRTTPQDGAPNARPQRPVPEVRGLTPQNLRSTPAKHAVDSLPRGWLRIGGARLFGGMVTIDGDELGFAPLERELSVGPHDITVISPASGQTLLHQTVHIGGYHTHSNAFSLLR